MIDAISRRSAHDHADLGGGRRLTHPMWPGSTLCRGRQESPGFAIRAGVDRTRYQYLSIPQLTTLSLEGDPKEKGHVPKPVPRYRTSDQPAPMARPNLIHLRGPARRRRHHRHLAESSLYAFGARSFDTTAALNLMNASSNGGTSTTASLPRRLPRVWAPTWRKASRPPDRRPARHRRVQARPSTANSA